MSGVTEHRFAELDPAVTERGYVIVNNLISFRQLRFVGVEHAAFFLVNQIPEGATCQSGGIRIEIETVCSVWIGERRVYRVDDIVVAVGVKYLCSERFQIVDRNWIDIERIKCDFRLASADEYTEKPSESVEEFKTFISVSPKDEVHVVAHYLKSDDSCTGELEGAESDEVHGDFVLVIGAENQLLIITWRTEMPEWSMGVKSIGEILPALCFCYVNRDAHIGNVVFGVCWRS